MKAFFMRKLNFVDMAHHIYILFSEKLNRFYIGNTDLVPEERLSQHNNVFYKNAFTSKGKPWVIFFSFQCTSREQARKIETHIKNMKSKKYILNLKQYPEMIEKLLNKFE